MVDIFLSYSRHDKERIVPLVKALEGQGWSVWWDRKIPPGKTFEEVIEAALKSARSVVVVWSEQSVRSYWVRTEAAEGAKRDVLVPVVIDDVEMPLAHRLRQASRLVGWDGISASPELELLFGSIKELIRKERDEPTKAVGHSEEHRDLVDRKPTHVAPKPAPPKPGWNRKLLVSVGVGLFAVLISGWLVVRWNRQTDVPSTPEAEHQIFNNWNQKPVLSNPTRPTQFTLQARTYITNIYDYHYEWNGANPSGMGMKLRSSDGKEFGPWEVFAGSGQGEKQNVNWVCSPKITLAAGTYTVIDPDPATWSQNDNSENRGMSLVNGFGFTTSQ